MIRSVRDGTPMVIGFDTSRGYFSVTTDGNKVRPEPGEPLRFESFTFKEAEKIRSMARVTYIVTHVEGRVIV